MNIAVTDDQPKEREKIINILTQYAASNQMEISVSEHESAEEFIADYRPLLYSAIFLDIYMDGMSGIEAAQKIREVDRDTIIIFLTTSVLSEILLILKSESFYYTICKGM